MMMYVTISFYVKPLFTCGLQGMEDGGKDQTHGRYCHHMERGDRVAG